jgi:hypothetical protein
MQGKMAIFLEGLISYDYILFGSSFLLFILLIILTIILRRKVVLAVFLGILSFSILILAPTLGYIKMHEYLFKNTTKLTSEKKLLFTKAVVVKGTLKNESKVDFESCKITASAFKVTGNAFKDYIFSFKPFKKMYITEYNIKKGQTRDFKIIVEPFTYSKDYNISIGADCR